MTNHEVDVLVITALKLERLAVREHLENVTVETETTLAADLGTSLSSPGQRIAVIETGPGNIDAGVMAVRAEEAFRPEYIVMFGIAGGVKDVGIGDVVASRKVYWVEGGKAETRFKARPEFAPVSPSLVQLAKAVAANNAWMDRAKGAAGSWPDTGRDPDGLIGPIVVGEKVVASERAQIAKVIASAYSDSIAIDMEDFGALRGGTASERAKVIAIRGISDLLSKKAEADADGSQPLAAANGAAFLFDLLDRLASSKTVVEAEASRGVPASADRVTQVLSVGRQLYPAGPQQDGLWERAGGDASRLLYDGPGATKWWHAIQLLEKGGGGAITLDALIKEMRGEYSGNADLAALG